MKPPIVFSTKSNFIDSTTSMDESHLNSTNRKKVPSVPKLNVHTPIQSPPIIGNYHQTTQDDTPNVPFRRRRISPGNNMNMRQGSGSFIGSSPNGSDVETLFDNDDSSIQATIKVDHHNNTNSNTNDEHSGLILVQELHALCANASTMTELTRLGSIITVETASTQDQFGRTALHIISENKYIVEAIWGPSHNNTVQRTPTGTNAITWNASFPSPSIQQHRMSSSSFNNDSQNSLESQNIISASLDEPNQEILSLLLLVVEQLWRTYPPAMVTTDDHGYIPFEFALYEWTESCFSHRDNGMTTSGYNATIQSIVRSVQVSSSIIPSIRELKNSVALRWFAVGMGGYQNQHGTVTNTGGSQRSVHSDVKLDQGCKFKYDVESNQRNPHQHQSIDPSTGASIGTCRIYPGHVQLTPIAFSSIYILSILLKLMDEITIDIDIELYNSARPNNSKKRRQSLADQLKNHAHKDMMASIVQTIASVPDFLKVCLFIDNETQRSRCLDSLLLRNVLFSKHSIGTGSWLTEMLRCPIKQVSDIAIKYLHIVSQPKIQGNNEILDIDPSKSQSPGKEFDDKDEQLRDEFYLEMSRVKDFIPSLLSLNDEQIEDAATTKIVQEVMDMIISRPFAVTVVFCDGWFLMLLIFGYRSAVNALLLGHSPETVLKYIYLANVGTFYFLIREIGKVISIGMITQQANVYITFWNLIDLLTTFLALISTVEIRCTFTPLRSLCAVTTGFMWLRVLSYLKGINMQLATFVLAILQIGRDLLWFAVILFVVVLMFSQMFFTLMVPNNCSQYEERHDNLECSQSEYYLKVYAILLGDFGLFKRENFQTILSIFLAVFFTFLTTTILLNVLIAVASDSYEKCLMRSNKLFGRARVLMIAELVSFQNLLSRHDVSDQVDTWWSRSFPCAKGCSRGSATFFIMSLSVTILWTVGEVMGSLLGSSYGNIWMSLGSVIVNVLLLCGVIFFLSAGTSERNNQYYSNRYLEWYSRYFQSTMVRLLGSSSCKTHLRGSESIWQGRLHYLRNEIIRISDDSDKNLKASMQSMESLIEIRDSRLRNQLAAISNGLQKTNEENEKLLDVLTKLLNTKLLESS